MIQKYTLYGWHLSYFTGKAWSYLKYKNVPLKRDFMNLRTLMVTVKKATGAAVMPVLRTPEGEWVQDTSTIIDLIEAEFPDNPVIPTGPVQRFAASLFEAWADEWWVPIAMHTRWSYPENYASFEAEAGDNLLPYFPQFLKRKAVQRTASMLRGALPVVGVRPQQFDVMERWTLSMLDHFEAHFANHSYLMGEAPCLADFALMGPMYGHLSRDPWPAREWVAPRPNLRAWIDRMADPHTRAGVISSDVEADTIPYTLVPVFEAIFREFVPLLQGTCEQVTAKAETMTKGQTFPRSLDDVTFPMGAGVFSRKALPFSLWMAQRTRDVFDNLPPDEKTAVETWVAPLGGQVFLDMDLPRLKRINVRVALDT